MIRRLAMLTLLAAAAPLAARAGAYGFSGFLDTGYIRSDTSADGRTVRVPAWDYGGQLSLSAVPLRPDLLQLLASVGYRAVESTQLDTKNRTGYLQYGTSLTALQNFPLTLTGFASRSETDFSATQATQLTGSSRVTTEGGSAYLHLGQAPVLRAALQRSDFENTGIGGLRTTGSSTLLSTSAAHHLENHSYNATYDTSWNGGSFADTNYRTHRVTFAGSSRASDALEVRVNEQYYLRNPTELAAGSPRFDDNVFGADASWRPAPRIVSSMGYSYHHLLADFRGLGENRESTSQSVRAGADWAATPEISYTGSLSAGMNEDRLGDATSRGVGESAGAGIRWMRRAGDTTWQAGGNGSVGSTHQDGQDLFAYGAGVNGGWNGALGAWTSSLSASTAYDSNLLGQAGWALRNQLTASADRRTLGGLLLRSQLQGSDTRQHGKLLGDTASQTLQALASAGYRTHNLTLTAGLTNGLAQGLAAPGGAQILPLKANTLSRYVVLSGATGLARGLLLSGFARYTSVTAPERPDTWEAAFNVRLTYSIGLFDLSAEDRYSVGAQGGPQLKTNVVLLRISRSFGATF